MNFHVFCTVTYIDKQRKPISNNWAYKNKKKCLKYLIMIRQQHKKGNLTLKCLWLVSKVAHRKPVGTITQVRSGSRVVVRP